MLDEKLAPAVNAYLAGLAKVYADYREKMGYQNPIHDQHYSTEEGQRYIRIVVEGAGRQRSVHSFIDKTNGDVLKAAGWKAPAKHARGNIYDAHGGLLNMGPHGPAYLR